METGQQVQWRISSLCGNGGCVAVAKSDEGFMVRDSKVDDGPILNFTTQDWASFVTGVKADAFGSN